MKHPPLPQQSGTWEWKTNCSSILVLWELSPWWWPSHPTVSQFFMICQIRRRVCRDGDRTVVTRESPVWGSSFYFFVYSESIKWEPKIRGIYECRCDERLQTKSKEFTRLPYTGLVLETEHLKIEMRLIDATFVNAMGEYVTQRSQAPRLD